MKKYICAAAALTVIIVFSISCQKEVSFTNPDNNLLGDSIYLSKMVEIDTTLAPGADTIFKSFFSYDNTKRLVKMVHYEPGTTDTVREEFFYQGSDTLPYKQVYHDIYEFAGSPTHYVDTIYYTYNNGLVAKDSVIEWELVSNDNYGVRVKEFTNQGTRVLERHKEYTLVGGVYVLDDDRSKAIFITTVSGNILLCSDTSSWQSYIATAQVQYDSKPNPYSQVLKIHYPTFQFLNGDGWATQYNNPADVNYTTVVSGPEHVTYTYQYRDDNYPLVSRLADVADNLYSKILYYYTAL